MRWIFPFQKELIIKELKRQHLPINPGYNWSWLEVWDLGQEIGLMEAVWRLCGIKEKSHV